MTKSTINKAKIGKFTSYKEDDYSVQLYHKQNGDIIYYACYQDTMDLDKNGKAKRKKFKVGAKSEGITATYAKRVRDSIIVNLRVGKAPEFIQKKIKPITVGDLYTKYISNRLSEAINDNNQKNIQKDQSVFKNHLSNLANTNVNLLDNEIITTLRRNKLKTHAPKTVNNILTLLRSILNFGINHEIIIKSPKIKLLTGIDNNRERYFSKGEISLILEHLKDNPILTIFVKLSLSTGGRLETIRNIKVKDINFSEMSISLVDLKGKHTGKNNATYFGFFNENLKMELQNFVIGLSPNTYIFSYSNKNRISTDYIQDNLQNLFNELFNMGLDLKDTKNRAVVHTLRHTFATQLATSEVDIFTIQRLMNHASIAMTQRYAHSDPRNGKNAINKLNLF